MNNDFRTGFEEGYRMIMGNLALLPLVPLQPLIPLNSTPFREGLKLGIKTAKKTNPDSFNNLFLR